MPKPSSLQFPIIFLLQFQLLNYKTKQGYNKHKIILNINPSIYHFKSLHIKRSLLILLLPEEMHLMCVKISVKPKFTKYMKSISKGSLKRCGVSPKMQNAKKKWMIHYYSKVATFWNKSITFSQQGCIYLIKNTIKTVILWNSIII